jgi:hypothetical protein
LEDNIKMNPKEIRYHSVICIHLAQEMGEWRSPVYTAMYTFQCNKCRGISRVTVSFWRILLGAVSAMRALARAQKQCHSGGRPKVKRTYGSSYNIAAGSINSLGIPIREVKLPRNNNYEPADLRKFALRSTNTT